MLPDPCVPTWRRYTAAAQAHQMREHAEHALRTQQQQAAWAQLREAGETQQRERSERLKAESAQLVAATAAGNTGAAFAGQVQSILQRLSELETLPPPTPAPTPPPPPPMESPQLQSTILSPPPRLGSGFPPSPAAATLELPPDIAATPGQLRDLERRVSELATPSMQALPMVLPAPSPSPAEFEVLRDRVLRLETIRPPSPPFLPRPATPNTSEADAAAAASEVRLLREKVSNFEGRVSTVENAAAEAVAAASKATAAASPTSSSALHAKETVAVIRNRLTEMEVEVAGRLTEVETRVCFLAESTSEVAAAAAALAPSLALPPPRSLPEPHASAVQEERLRGLVEAAVLAVEVRVQGRVDDVETRVAEMDGARRESAAAAAAVVAAAGAVESQRHLHGRVAELEELQELAVAATNGLAVEANDITQLLSLVDERLAALESAPPTPDSPLTDDELLVMFASVRDTERQLVEMRESRLREREGEEAEKAAVSSITAGGGRPGGSHQPTAACHVLSSQHRTCTKHARGDRPESVWTI